MVKVHCPKCKRFLFETDQTTILQSIKCAGCKEKLQIKVVTPRSTPEQINYKFADKAE